MTLWRTDSLSANLGNTATTELYWSHVKDPVGSVVGPPKSQAVPTLVRATSDPLY
jgi:hypothetical protein